MITALTSNKMIAPSFWIDPKTGNDYMLTVQYPEKQVKSLGDLKQIPLRASNNRTLPARAVTSTKVINTPTEVDHYQLRRIIDMYVRPSKTWEASPIASTSISDTMIPDSVSVTLRGMVQGMRASFKSFAIGLLLAVVLLYLILVAQFQSFVDPFIILLAVPPGMTRRAGLPAASPTPR